MPQEATTLKGACTYMLEQGNGRDNDGFVYGSWSALTHEGFGANFPPLRLNEQNQGTLKCGIYMDSIHLQYTCKIRHINDPRMAQGQSKVPDRQSRPPPNRATEPQSIC